MTAFFECMQKNRGRSYRSTTAKFSWYRMLRTLFCMSFPQQLPPPLEASIRYRNNKRLRNSFCAQSFSSHRSPGSCNVKPLVSRPLLRLLSSRQWPTHVMNSILLHIQYFGYAPDSNRIPSSLHLNPDTRTWNNVYSLHPVYIIFKHTPVWYPYCLLLSMVFSTIVDTWDTKFLLTHIR